MTSYYLELYLLTIPLFFALRVLGQVCFPSKHVSILRTLPKVLLLCLAMLWPFYL